MKIYVKHMVSQRCKMVVREELKKLGIYYVVVNLGEIDLLEDIRPEESRLLKINLQQSGLELLDDKRSVLVENIKNVIVEMIYFNTEYLQVNYSTFISEKLGYDYTYLANVFSEEKGITIQQFIILIKMERVKELLLYNELSLTEISYQMHYSSVAHLSTQFKKVTGFTPTYYKKIANKCRGNLEDV